MILYVTVELHSRVFLITSQYLDHMQIYLFLIANKQFEKPNCEKYMNHPAGYCRFSQTAGFQSPTSKAGCQQILHTGSLKDILNLVLPGKAFLLRSTAKGVHVGSLDVCGSLDIVGIRNQVRQT